MSKLLDIHIGNLIRKAQKKKCISSRELAKRMDVHAVQIVRWRNSNDIKVGKLFQICNALDISFEDFIALTD